MHRDSREILKSCAVPIASVVFHPLGRNAHNAWCTFPSSISQIIVPRRYKHTYMYTLEFIYFYIFFFHQVSCPFPFFFHIPFFHFLVPISLFFFILLYIIVSQRFTFVNCSYIPQMYVCVYSCIPICNTCQRV